MLNIEKIENDKDKILQENILPNVCWNRFDLRYGDNYNLISDLIARGKNKLYLLGGNLE